jgi:uncharacterized protein YegP (UPF0339 family)
MTKLVRALGLSLVMVAVAGLVGPPFAAGQVKKEKDTKVTAGTAVFEVHQGKNGKFYFNLRDSEGVLLALSGKGHETKLECQKVIETIRTSVARAKIEFKAEAPEEKTTVDKKTEDKKKKK